MSDRSHKPLAALAEDSWRRWQMDELSLPVTGRKSLVSGERGSLPGGSQIDLVKVREQARRSAYEEGYQAGFGEGRDSGYAEGHAQGATNGYHDGHAEGLEQGRTEAAHELKQQVQTVLQPLIPMAQQFDDALTQLRDEIAEQLVELALMTGNHLARDRLDIQPELILNIVRDLLHTEPMLTGKPRVWLHPDDLTLVREHLGCEFDAAGWSLQPDEQIRRGGCRATSTSGEIDATWEGRWDAIMSRTRRRQIHSAAASDAADGGEPQP